MTPTLSVDAAHATDSFVGVFPVTVNPSGSVGGVSSGGGGAGACCFVFVIVQVGTLDCGLESTTFEQPE
ncbi:MAG: hypothetical protein ACRELC_10000 [Gemmatimonadota bacterium]